MAGCSLAHQIAVIFLPCGMSFFIFPSSSFAFPLTISTYEYCQIFGYSSGLGNVFASGGPTSSIVHVWDLSREICSDRINIIPMAPEVAPDNLAVNKVCYSFALHRTGVKLILSMMSLSFLNLRSSSWFPESPSLCAPVRTALSSSLMCGIASSRC